MAHGRAGTPAAFASLCEPVRSALSARGFATPTEPQRRAIPTLAAGENALVVAPTGSGKTETALLPVFSRIVERGPDAGIAALLVTPLRALNRDLQERLEWWGEELELAVDVRHGDTTRYRRRKQAEDPPDVLITTPETLQAMLTGERLRAALAAVEHVVVDEIHELAGSKRGAQLAIGLERLAALAGPFQRVGLSATVGDPSAVGRLLAGDRPFEVVEVGRAGRIDVRVHRPTVTEADERLASELLADPELASHVRAIDELVADHESTLVFVNTRQTAEGLGARLNEVGTDIGIHHGSLSKDARVEVEEAFKAGELDALLCTSSMELGVDVGHVDHVIQYQSPRQVRRLLQRVGRAGHREGAVSRGTIVTGTADDTLEALAIARRAARGDVEPAEIHHGSLDTVANQVVGMVMGRGEIEAMRAYRLVTAAFPFRDLDEETFKEIVAELADNRVVYLDAEADRVSKTNGSWQYFYGNLSMIPDEATYDVEDLAGGRRIGTLDERFVVTFAEPGELFVQRGEMWRIVDVDEEEETVEVTPVEDPTAAVPSWTGAEIPVPFEVAQAVGETRAAVEARLAEADADAIAADLDERTPADADTIRRALSPLAEQDDPVPTADRIVIEQYGREVVVNACLGHKINETVGRTVSALVGQRTGSSVGFDCDPYRIELEVPGGVSATDVADVLTETDPDHVGSILELTLRNTDSLRLTLAQVAAKFGAIKDWRGSGGRSFSPGRLLEALRESPAYEEALREVLHDELAVEETAAVLERIQAGEIAVRTVGRLTPVGQDGRSAGKELLSPEHADASVVRTVRERILDDRILLACVHCGEWTRRTKVRRVPDQPECPRCESTRIAALNPWADEVVGAVRADEKDDEQRRQTERAYRSASLVQSHGRRAVVALAGRGVGPESAARIINRHRETEADFFRDILARERQYARTKAFWD